MAVLSKEDLIAKFNSAIGENLSDENLSLLEDINDTFDSMSDSEDWKSKYEENDKNWREKYKARFEGRTEIEEDTKDEVETYTPPTRYEDLFTVESEVLK